MREEETRYCTNCGAPYTVGARFCSGCGAKLGAEEAHTEGQSTGASDTAEKVKKTFEKGVSGLLYFLNQEDYIPYEAEEDRLIGTNQVYYRAKFDEMRMLKQKVSMNWSALFFGILWMLYRKMYGVAMGAMALWFVANCLGSLGGVLGLALAVCWGLFGNYLYMMTVQKRVTELETFGEPARSHYLEKYQGTSTTAVIIGVFAVCLLSVPFWLMIGLNILMFL